MLSEANKQAILNGATALSRDRRKCKYIGKNESSEFPYQFVYYGPNEVVEDIASISEQLCYLKNDKHNFDVIGLWKDGGEPFNLEKALNGEPLMYLYTNEKCWLYKNHENGNLIIEYENTDSHLEKIQPLQYLDKNLDLSEYYSMWQDNESETNTATLTLPCPLKEPRDEMWFISPWKEVSKSSYDRNVSERDFKERPYFASKADAQAWIDTLKNIGI